jgi:hypothetical protein
MWLYRLLHVHKSFTALYRQTQILFTELDDIFGQIAIPEFLAIPLSHIGVFQHEGTHQTIYARFPDIDGINANRANGIFNLQASHCLPNFFALARAITHQLATRNWNINFQDATANAAPAPALAIQNEYFKLPGLTRTPNPPSRQRLALAALSPLAAPAANTAIANVFNYVNLNISWINAMKSAWTVMMTGVTRTQILKEIPTTVSNSALLIVTDDSQVPAPAVDDDRWHLTGTSIDVLKGEPYNVAISFFAHYHPSANYLYNGTIAPAPGSVTLSASFPTTVNYSALLTKPTLNYDVFCERSLQKLTNQPN